MNLLCEDIKDLNNSFANLLNIPINVINKKAKQIIYNSFDYYDKNPKFKINFSFISSLKYFFLFLFLILFKIKIKSKFNGKKVNIILDNVEKNYVLEKFSKTLSYFETSLILCNKNLSETVNFKNKLVFFNVRSFFFQ